MADIKYIVECDASGALKSIKELDGAINQAAGTTTKAGGSSGPFGSLFAQFTAGTLVAGALRKGIGELKDVVADSIKSAIESEQAENNLKAALEITGRTVEGNIQHYKKFAAEQMRMTTYTDEEVESSQALLLQLTSLDQNGLDRATKGSMGLASTMGIDLHSATMMVTKAMEGNYGALGRVGIRVAENLTAEQKQASLLDQLEKLYGRSTAEVNTFGGSLKQLANNWDEVKEEAGRAIIETEGFGTAIVELNKAVSDFVTTGGLKTFFDNLTRNMPALKVFVDGLKLLTLVLRLQTAEAEHAAKVNEGLGTSVGIVGKVFAGAAPMLKIFGVNFEELVGMFTGAPAKINETGNKIRELTKEEIKAAEEAAKAKKKLADAAQEIINKYNPLRESISKIIEEKKKLTEAKKAGVIGWQDYETGMNACDEALRNIGDTIKTDTVPGLSQLEEMMRTTMAEIDKSADFTADNMASDLDKIVGGWKEAGPKVVTETKSFMQEVSTVVADAAREVAKSIVDTFNIKGLLGAEPKKLTFDSSYYDTMVAAATGAYDAVVAKTKSAYDEMEAAARTAFNAQELAADRAFESMCEAADRAHEDMMTSAKRAYDANELLITRAQQDADARRSRAETAQDRAYENQYERQKRAIEKSTMTEKQKNAALSALEKAYEAAKEARERAREDARIARERRREDAALARQKHYDDVKEMRERHYDDVKEARERRYEDQKEARQKAFELRMEALRAASLAKLLALQNAHQADLDKIRKDEDTARQKQADDEEKRQDSLWFKVKGIFGTAVEQMATIWVTGLITKILPSFDDIGDKAEETLGPSGLGKTVQDAATGIGNIFTGLATTLATILTTIATAVATVLTTLVTGVSTAIVTLATAIATAMVTLATGIATAAGILAAAAPALVVVGLIAVGIFATIALLKRLIAGAGGTGAGDGMGRVVERQDIQIGLLTMIFDTLNAGGNIKTTLWAISSKSDTSIANLISIKTSNWVISTATQISRDFLRTIAHYQTLSAGYLKTSRDYLKTSTGYLKTIVEKIGNLTSAASGAISTQTQLMVVHGTPSDPEYVLRGSQLGTLAGPAKTGAGAAAGQATIIENHIYLDGYEMKVFITKTIREWSKSELMQIHPRAIRAY